MGADRKFAMTDFQLPETRYAQSGDVSIAYQVMGDGPIDLILVPGYVSHIEFVARITRRHCIYTAAGKLCPRGDVRQERARAVGPDGGRAVAGGAHGRCPRLMDTVGSKRAALAGFSKAAA